MSRKTTKRGWVDGVSGGHNLLKRLSVEQRTLAEVWHCVDVGGIEEVD